MKNLHKNSFLFPPFFKTFVESLLYNRLFSNTNNTVKNEPKV